MQNDRLLGYAVLLTLFGAQRACRLAISAAKRGEITKAKRYFAKGLKLALWHVWLKRKFLR